MMPSAGKQLFWIRIIPILCVLVVGAYLWRVMVDMSEPIMAWIGYSPISFVYGKLGVADFSRGFPAGFELYDKSLFMRIYLFAYSVFGLLPEKLIPAVIGFQIAALACAFFYLTRTIFPDSTVCVPLTVILLVVASYARCMDFARYDLFADSLVLVLYYFIAEAFRLFSIAFFVRGRLIASALLMAICFMIYPTYAVVGLVFIAAAYLIRPAGISKVRLAGAAGIFAALSLLWAFNTFDPTSITGTAIDRSTWFSLTQLSSFHMYPIHFGIFSFRAWERFFPFLSFLVLFLVYATFFPVRPVDKKLFAGTTAVLVLSVVGVLFSGTEISSFLIKLSLHRANDLVIDIGLVYIVYGLWHEISRSGPWRKALAVVVLTSPFFLKPGFPLLFTTLLVFPLLIRYEQPRKIGLLACLAGGWSLLMIYRLSGILDTWQWSISVAIGSYWFIAWFAVAVAVFWLIVSKIRQEDAKRILNMGLVMLIVVAAGAYWTNAQEKGFASRKLFADFKDAQIWARDNTAAKVLFMVDPTISYGWRDYSRRSSFGNMREWIFTSWEYNSNYATFREGMNRFNEFGAEPTTFLAVSGTVHDKYDKMVAHIRHGYYNYPDIWRLKLAEKYGIDYFVLMKKNIKQEPKLRKVYENDSFVIYSAPKNL